MMLFIFYWCHHNSISGRGRQSALIVYLIKFHLTEMIICNQCCNLRLCAKWKAAVTNTNSSILEHISTATAIPEYWPSLVCWYVDTFIFNHELINVTPEGQSFFNSFLFLFRLSAALFWCNNVCDGAPGRQSPDCESVRRSHLRVRYVSGLVWQSLCCLSLLGNDSKGIQQDSQESSFSMHLRRRSAVCTSASAPLQNGPLDCAWRHMGALFEATSIKLHN